MRLLYVPLLLSLSSCVMSAEPPAPPVTSPVVEVPAVTAPPAPPVVSEPPRSEVTYLSVPPVVAVAPSKPTGKGGKPAPEPSPQQLIADAQKEARVAPTKRGYFGGRGVQRYLWMPYKIYDVYLTPSAQTRIELPPGEMLAHAFILNPRSFQFSTATIGNEMTATSVILVRPCAHGEGEGDGACVPSPDVDVALTSASGRSYDLHFIIGRVGMLGVTWELTPIPLLQVEEPGMLPRREP